VIQSAQSTNVTSLGLVTDNIPVTQETAAVQELSPLSPLSPLSAYTLSRVYKGFRPTGDTGDTGDRSSSPALGPRSLHPLTGAGHASSLVGKGGNRTVRRPALNLYNFWSGDLFSGRLAQLPDRCGTDLVLSGIEGPLGWVAGRSTSLAPKAARTGRNQINVLTCSIWLAPVGHRRQPSLIVGRSTPPRAALCCPPGQRFVPQCFETTASGKWLTTDIPPEAD